MKGPTLVAVCLTLSTLASGFTPLNVARSPPRTNYVISSSATETSPTVDAFASYDMRDADQGICTRDTIIGTGAVAEKGKVVVVSYVGRIMASGKQFDEGQYAFRLGDRKVIRGWDQGFADMKVGGKRTLRIPPKFGYGDEGYTFLVPANAHIEFDIELTSVAANAVEEAVALAYAQRMRLGLMAFLLALFAISPMLG